MPCSAIIRKAELEDIDAIAELAKQLADYHRKLDRYYKPGSETESEFKKFLARNMGRRNTRVLVAEIDGRIIGYFIGKIERPNPCFVPEKIGKISDAFIKEKYRKSGTGRAMFSELLKWFRKKGIKHIELSVDSRNKLGIKVWQNLGFKEFMKKMRLDLK